MENQIKLTNTKMVNDTKIRNRTVSENLNLLRSVVKKFLNRGYDYEELFQVGSIGLIKAVNNYNAEYGAKFSTYAVPLIMGEIQRFIRDDNPIHVSRSLKELSIRCLKEKERIENCFMREAKISEIAKACNISEYDVSEALNASCPPESIYREMNSDEESSLTLIDKLTDDKTNEFFTRIFVQQALEFLDLKDRKLIYLRFICGKTQAEISHTMGVSQVQVSRLLKKALIKLRNYME